MFVIRLARQRDAANLAAMSRELIEHGLGWSWTPQRIRVRIGAPDTNVIISEVDGQLAGFAMLRYFEEHAHLLLFAVKPGFRRQGCGQALWSWLKTTALVAGIGTVHLEVRARNTSARDFYRRLGFVDVETVKGYYNGREPALRMRLQLSQLAHSSRD